VEPIFSPVGLLVVAGLLSVLTPLLWAGASHRQRALTRFARRASLLAFAGRHGGPERYVQDRLWPTRDFHASTGG
jgi:hypothetical protein